MAQFNLATMYADGQIEGNVNKIQAYAWMAEAAKNGLDKAKSALDLLAESMGSAEISRAKSEGVSLSKRISDKDTTSPVRPEEDYYIVAASVKKKSVGGSSTDKAFSARPKRSQRMLRRR